MKKSPKIKNTNKELSLDISNTNMSLKTNKKSFDEMNDVNDINKFDYKNLTMENFNEDKLLKQEYNFISRGSSIITGKLIKHAISVLDRNLAKSKLKKYIEYDFIVNDIEKGVFEFSLVDVASNQYNFDFVELIYNRKIEDICDNLDTHNLNIDNQTLVKSILLGDLKPQTLAFLPPEHIHPMRYKDILNKIELREKTMNNLRTTDMYKCKKCGERKFKISTMQLRCADEPETKFLTCLVCYNTFTQ